MSLSNLLRNAVLMLWLVWPGLSAANSLLLTPERSGQRANIHTDLLRDPEATLEIADILRPDVQAAFAPSQGVSGGSIENTAHWLRITVQRPAGDQREWWLEVHPLNLYDLRLYWPDGKDGYREQRSGERVEFRAGRDEIYRQFVFRLPLQDDAPLTFYLRAHDPGGAVYPITFHTRDDLNQSIRRGELIAGLIYGLMLGLAIYNLFLAISLRDAAYVWYVGSALGLTAFIAHLFGHTAQYLWPAWPDAVAAGRVLIPATWGMFLSLFITAFFQLRRFMPLAWRIYQLITLSYVLIIALRLAGIHAVSAWMLANFPFLTVPLTLGVAIVRWQQGFHAARYFLLGYGVLLVCTTLFLLRIQGVLTPSPLTEYAVPVAAAFEALVFSLALADRINDLRQQGSRAMVDELTGLGNRRMLDQSFEEAQYQADRQGLLIGIVAMDLDNFKPINDSHGHAAGDAVLQVISRRLQGCIRDNDRLARIGGDEFVLLLTDLEDVRAGDEILHRLQEVCRAPISYGGHLLRVTPSLGVAFYPRDGSDLATLNRCADTALYEAKRQGRDTLCVYQEAALPET